MKSDRGNILIADDEPLKILTLKKQVQAAGFRTVTHPDANTALQTLQRENFDVLVTDLRMPGMNGIQLLEKARAICPGIHVILMTAYGSIDTAVEAMKKGAVDYLTKPFAASELILRIENLLASNRSKPVSSKPNDVLMQRDIIGAHPAIRKVISVAERVAGRETTVLIQGESGVGKGLIAEFIHGCSVRKRKPFIKVSCASLSKDVFESELFGHEKGAFTGAAYTRKGRFELAEEGTLFLDEVDDVPPALQVKLLRFLEEREFERVGGEVTLKGNVRVICASKENLHDLVKRGVFRQDLYYRLNIVKVLIPPLRERREDIPLLAEAFLERFRGEKVLELSGETLGLMSDYPWPGNVRELENCIERAVILKDEGVIEPGDLPLEVVTFSRFSPPQENGGPVTSIDLRDAIRETERKLIEWALEVAKGNQVKAAELLHIPRTTLRDKMLRIKDLGDNEAEGEPESPGDGIPPI
ncbi:MAG: sigma-54-dependent transcriptional regulator [Planctomycetota bacterium]|jgi:DNA-binding NtrC family response regulator